MPAAAVIPAPIAYIKVVAVKKLVVELWAWLASLGFSTYWDATGPFLLANCVLLVGAQRTRTFTLKKLECSKQAYCSDILAWNNGIGRLVLFCWFLGPS